MKQNLFNKLWLRVGMIVAIMTTALSGTAWAADESVDFSTQGYTNQQAIESYTGTNFSITFNKGTNSNAPKYYTSGTAIRAYGGNTITVSSTSKTIAKIEITFGSSDGSNAITTNVGTYSNGTWTGSASSVTFTIGGTSGNRRIAGIAVTYAGSTPMETVATPTFSVVGGTYTSAQTVTISCATSGATIYYTTDGSTPSTESSVYNSALTISETTTVKAIAAKEGMNNSAVASAAYTINLPYSGPDYVRVTSLDYLTDGAKVIVAARYNLTATSYYAMTAAVTGKPTGVEFTSTTSSNGEILPASIVNSESTYSWTVGVTSDGYTFTNANDEVLGYTSSTNFAAGGNNTVWTISRATAGSSAMVAEYEGFYIINKNNTARGIALNNSYNFGPYDKSNNNASGYNFYLDIFVQGATPAVDPAITANNVDINYDVNSGSIEYTLTNEVTGGVLSAAITGGNEGNWLSLGDVGVNVPFTCTANSTATERTAQVTLTYTYNTSETVNHVVTVTQAADPNAVMTITEVRTQGTGYVQTKGIVTNVSGKTAYIQDSNAAIVVFDSQTDLSCAVGDEIRVSGTLSDYHGLLEITSPTISVLTQNNTVTPEVMTIAQVIASTKQGWFVKIENATVTEIGSSNNNTIAQGENTITLHGNLGEVEENDIITFNGNIGCYTNVQIVNPTEVTVTGSVTPTTYTITWEENANNTEIFVYDAADENTSLTSPASVAANTTINVSVSAASGFTLDALTIKDAGNNDITYSEIGEGYYQFTMPASNVTITATAVAATPPTPVSGKYVKVTSTSDITDGQYLIVYEDGAVAFDGSLETLDVASNTIDVIITNDEITATNETVAAEFTIDVTEGTIKSASGFYIGRNTDTNGMLTNATTTYANTFSIDDDGNADIVSSGGAYLRYNSDSGQTRFRYFKSSTYTGQKAIQLYKFVADVATETVTVTSAGYATFASTNALDFTGKDIKAYIATANGTEGVNFTQINKVPANTGVLLVGTEGQIVNAEVPRLTGNTDATTGNVFVPGAGVAVSSEGTGVKNYILSNGSEGVGFYPASGKTVAVGKAYISVSTETNVKGFIMLPDSDDPTAIEMVNGQSSMVNEIYNLAGQRISKMQKGINIVNGKKILY